MAVAAGARAGWAPAPLALMGDERLARLAAAGHERAFAVVYERHHQALYRYCRSILRHDADAQDALQSTFTAAFAALARGDRDAPIRPWLFRIAHNEAVSALRRRRPTTDLTEATDASTRSVEDQVAERAEVGLLLHDLRQLSSRQRSALVMRELSGLSHEEIAIALGTSVGAAKQTIYEARRTLFEFAEGRAMDCDEIRRTVSDADGRALRSRRVRAHLRECSGCTSFAQSITEHTAQLGALAPVLPGAVAAGLLERLLRAGAGHGAGAAGLAGATAGKVATAGLAANTLAGVAVVASATVGVTIGVSRLVHEAGRAGPAHPAVPAAVRTRSRVAPHSLVGQPLSGSLQSPGRTVGAGASTSSTGTPSATGTPSQAAASAARRGSSSSTSAGIRHGSVAPGQGNHSGAGAPAGQGSGSAVQGTTTTGPPPWAGSGKPTSTGSGKPTSTGSGKPTSTGSGKPTPPGSGKGASTGSGKSPQGGSGRPPQAGSGRPPQAGSRGSGAAGSTRSGAAGPAGSGASGPGRSAAGGNGHAHAGGAPPPTGAGESPAKASGPSRTNGQRQSAAPAANASSVD